MDISLVTGAVTAIQAARRIGSAALKVRDFNKFAGTIAEINEQLLGAQESLFAHNAEMMDLQRKYHEASEELRKLKAVAAERERYSLHELSPGTFVYRVKTLPGTDGNAEHAEPVHYLCQPCFDKGIKSVLQRHESWSVINWRCTVCECEYDSGQRVPTVRG